jgi:hypothetical protein
VQAEALEVVVRAGQAGDLQLAGVAGAGVHLADGQRAAEDATDLDRQTLAQALDLGVPGDRLGHDPVAQEGPELAEHAQRRPGRRAS